MQPLSGLLLRAEAYLVNTEIMLQFLKYENYKTLQDLFNIWKNFQNSFRNPHHFYFRMFSQWLSAAKHCTGLVDLHNLTLNALFLQVIKVEYEVHMMKERRVLGQCSWKQLFKQRILPIVSFFGGQGQYLLHI